MQFSILASLPDDARRTLLANARRRSFARGEVVVHEGDPADSLHLVASGRLAVRVSLASGHVATLRLLTPGDHFGELALLDRAVPRRSATVAALEPTETWSIASATFDALRADHPAVEALVVAALADRVDDLSRRLVEAMYEGLDRRVYGQLAYLCEVYDEGTSPVTIPLTQETLAELVGGTRPSVNGVLKRLQARGLVTLSRGRMTVPDPAALALLLR